MTGSRNSTRRIPWRLACILGILIVQSVLYADTREPDETRLTSLGVSPDNLIRNGDFAISTVGWKCAFYQLHANGKIDWVERPPEGGMLSLKMQIAGGIRDDLAHAQLYQSGITVAVNRWYRVHAELRADAPGTHAIVSLRQNRPSLDELDFPRAVLITPEWGPITYFTHTSGAARDAQLNILPAGPLELDNVQLNLCDGPRPPVEVGVNLIINGEFDFGPRGWICDNTPSALGARLFVRPREAGGMLQLVCPSAASGNEARIIAKPLPIRYGAIYELKLEARAPIPTAMAVGVEDAHGNSRPGPPLEALNLTSEWQPFSRLWEPMIDCEIGQLVFSPQGTVEIDHVSFTAVSIEDRE